jgi:hypothetical protein
MGQHKLKIGFKPPYQKTSKSSAILCRKCNTNILRIPVGYYTYNVSGVCSPCIETERFFKSQQKGVANG